MIELRNVFFSVPAPDGGRRLIVDDVSLSIEPRTISCLMGTSGCGKTTLLRLMAGLIKPDSGEVLIFGQDIAHMREREVNKIRREMGFVFQYSALFDSLSVAENIAFGLERKKTPKKVMRQTVTTLLQEVGLPGIGDKYPSELSGGMRKRVAMARALATNPKVVLYDEPDSGLDPVMTSVINELLVEMRDTKGTTNVVVSHNVDAIWKIADRVMMFNAGKIVADGTPAEVGECDSDVVQQFIKGLPNGPLHQDKDFGKKEAAKKARLKLRLPVPHLPVPHFPTLPLRKKDREAKEQAEKSEQARD